MTVIRVSKIALANTRFAPTVSLLATRTSLLSTADCEQRTQRATTSQPLNLKNLDIRFFFFIIYSKSIINVGNMSQKSKMVILMGNLLFQCHDIFNNYLTSIILQENENIPDFSP